MSRLTEDLVGINEIAIMANRSRQAVANWRARNVDFPAPVAQLASGPVFRRSHIRSWLRRRKVPMAHVFSTINLKGGVGKTTTTVAMAEFMSGELGKKVLVIDLDPQTNATVMLIGEDRWRDLNLQEHTICRLFQDALDPENKRFNFDATLQRRVSNVSEAQTIDLLPSSLDLIDVQDRLASVPSGQYYSVNPTALLRRAVKTHLDDYDVVIVDCPPNLGIITLNGLRISDGFVIPTIPDVLSTYGIPQILSRVSHFAEETAEDVEPLGIVVTKFQVNSTVHRNTLKQLKKDKRMPPVFDAIIPQSNQYADAAEYGSPRTLRQKWGYQQSGGQSLADKFARLAEQVVAKLEG